MSLDKIDFKRPNWHKFGMLQFLIDKYTIIKHILINQTFNNVSGTFRRENIKWCETTQGEQVNRAKPPDTAFNK